VVNKANEQDVLLSDQEKENNLKEDEVQSTTSLKLFQSYKSSSNQNYFLTKELEGLSQIEWDNIEDGYLPIQRNKISEYNIGKIMVNSYLIEHDLPLKSLRYNTDAAIFTMNILNYLTTPFFFGIILLIYFLHLFQKYENGQIKFLITQPTKRRAIVISDCTYFLKKISGLLVYILIIAFLSSFIWSRSISINFPMLITFFGNPKIIPIWLYVLILISAFYFIGFFIFLLTYLLVIVSKKVIFSVLLSLLIMVSINGLIQLFPSQVTHVVNPFSYVWAQKVATGTDQQSDVHTYNSQINVDGKVVTMEVAIENARYYAYDSLSRRNGYIDIVYLPIVLVVFIFLLFELIVVYLNRYNI